MAGDAFYDHYRTLAASRKHPETAQLALDDFAETYLKAVQVENSSENGISSAQDCLYEISQSPELFVAATSRWLTDDRYIKLAFLLLSKVSVQYLQQPTAQFYDLSQLDEECSILAGCRLITRYIAPSVSLGWALSLARAFPESDKATQASQLLLQYHIEEFPSTTLQLLSHEDSPFKSVEMVDVALNTLKQQKAWLDQLPRLPEMSMSTEMRLTFSSVKRSQERDIHRNSDKHSIFDQIVSKQHFKYATKTAVEFSTGDQLHEQTLEMAPFSVYLEIPLSERTDPQAGREKRRTFWNGLPQ